jgi:hypothetical protein
MTTNLLFAVFEDFNEHKEEPPPPIEVLAPGSDEIDLIRGEAWTDGYLTGRQEPGQTSGAANWSAKLLSSLDELDVKAADAVTSASLAVADLLVNAIIAGVSDDWSAGLSSRVRMIAERIKPALTVAPEFILWDDGGTERRFGNISSLSRALDDGIVGESVTIKWQRGEATISREALLEDLREAVVPLSAGLADEQSVRQSS